MQKLRRRVQTKRPPSLPRLRPRLFVWSRLAQAEGQSDCEKSVGLIGAWATHTLSRGAYIHPRVLIEFAFFDPAQILLLIGVIYLLTVLVSAQPGSRHVRASFPETFYESGICRISGGYSLFLRARRPALTPTRQAPVPPAPRPSLTQRVGRPALIR